MTITWGFADWTHKNFGYPVGDLSRDLYLPPVIVYKDHVTIVNIAGGGIFVGGLYWYLNRK